MQLSVRPYLSFVASLALLTGSLFGQTTWKYHQSFLTVDHENGSLVTTPASGIAYALVGRRVGPRDVEFIDTDVIAQPLDAEGNLDLDVPMFVGEQVILLIVVPWDYAQPEAFSAHLDMIDIGLFDMSMVGMEHHVYAPKVALSKLGTVFGDLNGKVYLNGQSLQSDILTGLPVRVGLLDTTTMDFWSAGQMVTGKALGGYAVYFPTPVSDFVFETSDLFVGQGAAGQPIEYAIFDAETAEVLTAGPIPANGRVRVQPGYAVENVDIVLYEPSGFLLTSWGQDCILPGSHCQIVNYECNIVWTMLHDSGLTCTIDDDGVFYEPPPDDGSGTTLTVCEIEETEESTTVTYEVFDEFGAQVTLPIPGAPTKVTATHKETKTTSSTIKKRNGLIRCTAKFVPSGKVLARKTREVWCQFECGYCIGDAPNVICYVGPMIYEDKEHFQTNGWSFKSIDLGYDTVNCDEFVPGIPVTSEPCD